jgi:hypothetical protein
MKKQLSETASIFLNLIESNSNGQQVLSTVRQIAKKYGYTISDENVAFRRNHLVLFADFMASNPEGNDLDFIDELGDNFKINADNREEIRVKLPAVMAKPILAPRIPRPVSESSGNHMVVVSCNNHEDGYDGEGGFADRVIKAARGFGLKFQGDTTGGGMADLEFKGPDEPSCRGFMKAVENISFSTIELEDDVFEGVLEDIEYYPPDALEYQ